MYSKTVGHVFHVAICKATSKAQNLGSGGSRFTNEHIGAHQANRQGGFEGRLVGGDVPVP